MTDITGSEIDRIASQIDEWNNPDELRVALMSRFPKWAEDKSGGRRRFSFFTKQILGRADWESSAKGIKYRAIQDRTVLSGPRGRRIQMITDVGGKYLGSPKNVKTYTRHGNVYGKNVKTGRRARIS